MDLGAFELPIHCSRCLGVWFVCDCAASQTYPRSGRCVGSRVSPALQRLPGWYIQVSHPHQFGTALQFRLVLNSFKASVLFLLVIGTQSRIKERCMRCVEIASCSAICPSWPYPSEFVFHNSFPMVWFLVWLHTVSVCVTAWFPDPFT